MIAEHEIRTRSYLLWETAGRPEGRDMEFWFLAKSQLEVESRAPSPWRRPKMFIVPSASVSSPPRKVIASRIPGATPVATAIAATQ